MGDAADRGGSKLSQKNATAPPSLALARRVQPHPNPSPSWGRASQSWRGCLYTALATIIFFTSAIALAGFSPFGQALAQFMIVWQR